MKAIESAVKLEWKSASITGTQLRETVSGQYYAYRIKPGEWRAGRMMFNIETDFRLIFSSFAVAKAYCQRYESDKVIIVGEEANQ
jgi:hypothetical protein